MTPTIAPTPRPIANLVTSAEGKEAIKAYEQFREFAYPDSGGIWTIGWGFTKYVDNRPVKKGDRMAREMADKMFDLILPKYERRVRELIKRPLLQHEFDALVMFCYNAGTGWEDAQGKFHLYNIWQKANANTPAKEMEAYWRGLAITANGIPSDGLVRRRKTESTLYVSGAVNFYEKKK